MTYFYLVRWLASKPKLAGKTIRAGPSEISWELVLRHRGQVTWYRMSDDVLKNGEAFAIKWDPDTEEALKFLSSLKTDGAIEVEPGRFPNTSKDTLMFVRLLRKGEAQVLEDNNVLRYKLGRDILVFEPRRNMEDQFRVEVSEKPGEARFSQAVPLWFGRKSVLLDEEKPADKAHLTIKIIEHGDTVDVERFPVAIAGRWNGVRITKDLLKTLVHKFELLKKKLYVPLKLEHSGVKESEEVKNEGPALGWVTKLWIEGDTLYANLTKVPKAVARLIHNCQYASVSPEIAKNFDGEPDVLVGVALLGAALPAMTSLPKLMVLYNSRQQEYDAPEIPMSAFGGGDEMTEEAKVEEKEVDQSLKKTLETSGVNLLTDPRLGLLFQRSKVPGELDPLVHKLKEKGYPRVLAEEMLELLPEASVEKLDVIPDYDASMWEARLDVLADRAKLPEKAEKVVDELTEFLEMHGEDLEEEVKKRAEAILEEAKKNKGITEVEEAIAKEGTKTYPSAPSKKETYPEKSPNVEVLEMQKLKSELYKRARAETDHLVALFQSKGFSPNQAAILNRLLTSLDPILTPTNDPAGSRALLFQLLESMEPSIQTFSRVAPVEDRPEIDMVEEIFKHSRQGRRR